MEKYDIEVENRGFKKTINCRLTENQYQSLIDMSNDLNIGTSRLLRRIINVMNHMKMQEIKNWVLNKDNNTRHLTLKEVIEKDIFENEKPEKTILTSDDIGDISKYNKKGLK